MIGIAGRGRCWAVAAAVMPVALVAAGTPGCGSRHGTVPVEGVVTFAGKPPPATCTLVFRPEVAEGAASRCRPGRADTDASGRFSAGSFRSGEGLFPGRYLVDVLCWRVRPGHDNPHGESLLPANFAAQPLVVPDEARAVQYDLDVVPPGGAAGR